MTESLWTKDSSKFIKIGFKILKRYFLIPDDAVDRRKLGFFFKKRKNCESLIGNVLSKIM